MITLKLCFFASLSEALNTREDSITLPKGSSLAQLKQALFERGKPWQALADANILCAINHEMIRTEDVRLNHNDEVAFFPPVTGG